MKKKRLMASFGMGLFAVGFNLSFDWLAKGILPGKNLVNIAAYTLFFVIYMSLSWTAFFKNMEPVFSLKTLLSFCVGFLMIFALVGFMWLQRAAGTNIANMPKISSLSEIDPMWIMFLWIMFSGIFFRRNSLKV